MTRHRFTRTAKGIVVSNGAAGQLSFRIGKAARRRPPSTSPEVPWISPRPPSKHAVVATTLTLALSGIGNHHPVQVHGTGTIDQGRLVLDLRVEAAPLDLDPVLLVLAGVDPLLAIAAGAISAPPTDEPLGMRGRADLLGEGGAGQGAVELRSVLATADGGLSLAVNVGPARAALEVGERVAEIDEGTVLVRGATILGERALRTSRGRELLLIGTLRAYDIGALVARPRPLTLPPTRVIRVGGGSAFRLAFDVRTQDQPE